jgi:hypothetical protein
MKTLLAVAAVALLLRCGSPPSFPNEPPLRHDPGVKEKTETPRPAKGVPRVEMDESTRSSVLMIVICTAALFLLALILGFAQRAGGAIVPAGISAALFGPTIALGISARRVAHVIAGAGSPFEFAPFALAMWNENQPVLAGLYSGTAALIILLVVVGVMRNPELDSKGIGAVLTITVFLALAGAAASFVCFIGMNRLLLAVIDPVVSDPLPRSLRGMTLAGVSQGIGSRYMITIAVSLGTAIVLLVTIGVSLARRQTRKSIAIVALALALAIFAALVERSWSDALATAARTGRVPVDRLLTR